MLNLGQAFEEGLAFAKGGQKSLVLVEVPLVLLYVLALDRDRPEQAEGQPKHPGHPAEEAYLLGGERFARSCNQERSPGLLVHADGDRLAPADGPGSRMPVCSLLAAASISAPGDGLGPSPRRGRRKNAARRRRRRRRTKYTRHSRPSSTADRSSGAAASTARNSASCCVAHPEEAVNWSPGEPTGGPPRLLSKP